jgi:hypothetical protein
MSAALHSHSLTVLVLFLLLPPQQIREDTGNGGVYLSNVHEVPVACLVRGD